MPATRRRSRIAPPRLRLLALCAALAATSLAGADTITERMATEGMVGWRGSKPSGSVVVVQLIGLNDLHGHLTSVGELEGDLENRRVGGAPALAGVIRGERLSNPARTLVLFAGDSFGGSPPVSGLLRDEPTLLFLNELADGDCKVAKPQKADGPVPGNGVVATRCRVVAAVGNHEFDRGGTELERDIYGGAHPAGPVMGHAWGGSKLTWLGANVVHAGSGAPFLPGSAVVDLAGVRIGVIGIVTSETPQLEPKGRVADLDFLPEVASINASLANLKKLKVDAVVLLIHEGFTAPTTPQVAPMAPAEVNGRLTRILSEVDPGIDVVISGHTHKFTNLLFEGRDPRPMLVTQARADGTSYATVELAVDLAQHAVVEKGATVQTVWSAGDPGRRPDEKIAKLIKQAVIEVAPVVTQVHGEARHPITRTLSDSGESALGNLVADAERSVAGTEIAFMNPGGLRADLAAGPLSYGALYAVQPFGNHVMRCTMSGAQILRLLESQWSGAHAENPVILKVSGLSYLYNWSRPAQHRVVAAYDAAGNPLDTERRYTVAISDYLLGGGDQFPVLGEVTDAVDVMPDLDALITYVRAAKGPVAASIEGRITRVSTK